MGGAVDNLSRWEGPRESVGRASRENRLRTELAGNSSSQERQLPNGDTSDSGIH